MSLAEGQMLENVDFLVPDRVNKTDVTSFTELFHMTSHVVVYRVVIVTYRYSLSD